MMAPLLSRPASSEKIRRDIRVLESEVQAIRAKRDGQNRAIAERQTKIDRLKSQLAIIAERAPVLPAMGCPS
jgi:peptidoglycan hydrolase CwlO-like protein